MWLSILGVVIGGIITIGTAICIENLRRPKLRLRLCEPRDNDYRGQNRPAENARFVNLILHNTNLSWWARWMSRNPATQCHGTITFHHLDGQNVFDRSMPIRWDGVPEPVPMKIVVGNQTLLLYDPLVSIMQNVDVYPGEHRILNVAARFDDDDDCFGWCNENYFSDPKWRNPQWQLPKGRYLVKVTITSAGQQCSRTFRLVNDVPVADFRIIEAQDGDIARDCAGSPVGYEPGAHRMTQKRYLIEFIGGDWDGKTLDSHSPDETERMHALTCLSMTRKGRVGRAFHGVSMDVSDRLKKQEISMSDVKPPEGGRTHKYTVVERLDEGDEVLIRMQYSVRDPSQEKRTE